MSLESRICIECESRFQPKCYRHRVCSDACRLERARRTSRNWAKENPGRVRGYYNAEKSREIYKEKCKVDPGFSSRYSRTPKGKWHSYKSNATARGYEFSISFEDFTGLLSKVCYYCNREACNGVDRIDNEIGYVLENCRPCCGICNIMKGAMTEEEFFHHLEQIIETRIKNTE